MTNLLFLIFHIWCNKVVALLCLSCFLIYSAFIVALSSKHLQPTGYCCCFFKIACLTSISNIIQLCVIISYLYMACKSFKTYWIFLVIKLPYKCSSVKCFSTNVRKHSPSRGATLLQKGAFKLITINFFILLLLFPSYYCVLWWRFI